MFLAFVLVTFQQIDVSKTFRVIVEWISHSYFPGRAIWLGKPGGKSAMRNWTKVIAVLGTGLTMNVFAQDTGSDALMRAGLDPAKYVAGMTSIVSVRVPWTEAARVAFAAVDVYNTDGNLARLGAGKDETLPVPRAQILWTADALSGYAIDCLVTGDAQSFMASRFDGERERENRRDVPVARNGDRISFFMEKGTAGNVYLHSVGAPWAFKECSIIAVTER
jgi:hypothetical protein